MALKKHLYRNSAAVFARKIRTAWSRYNPVELRGRLWLKFIEAEVYLKDRINRRHYHIISHTAFVQRRKTDVMFIFGSGASLRDVTDEEWAKIDRYETLGWRLFVLQEYVHADYVMIREMGQRASFRDRQAQKRDCQEMANWIRGNDRLSNAAIIVQEGWRAVAGNRFIGGRFAPQDYTYIRFHNGQRQAGALPGESFAEGVTHIQGTLTDALNIAFLGGWRHIVLIGIDLYDSAYFNVAPGESNPNWVYAASGPEQPHATAQSGIVDTVRIWAGWMAERGTQVSVYNPKSLLAQVIPVFSWDMLDEQHPE